MIEKSLKKLEEYLDLVPTRFLQIPAAAQVKRPAPGKWSKREILGHLIDSALHNWQRVAIAHESEGPYVAQPYLQKELVTNNAYQQLPAPQIVGLWESMNRQFLVVCQQLDQTQLSKEIHMPYADDLVADLAYLVNDYVVHLEHHLKQIFGSLENLQRVAGWQIGVAEAKALLEAQQADRFIELKKRGTLSVEYYAPQGKDLQTPHRQDELYVIISGEGQFYCDGRRQPFGPGEVLFVPAGIEHRFENFSADFATWVIFYGPDGGEIPTTNALVDTQVIDGQAFQISTSQNHLDFDLIHNFLQTSYWASQRSRARIERSLLNSLCFGIYQEGQQVGLARVVTDYAVFGYLADVFVLEKHQGKGLGKWLIQTILEYPSLAGIKWTLATADAQGLYEQFGFQQTPRPERIMERERKNGF